ARRPPARALRNRGAAPLLGGGPSRRRDAARRKRVRRAALRAHRGRSSRAVDGALVVDGRVAPGGLASTARGGLPAPAARASDPHPARAAPGLRTALHG